MSSSTTSSERAEAPRAAAYVRWLAACVAGLLIAIAGFNAFIDPYDVFGAPPVDGINRVKHGIRTHTRTAKAYVVRRLQPATIILGSSRAESAFRPDHPAFGARPVYNLAFSGAGIYEMLRYFQHATAVAPVREALVAIDFGMFDAENAKPTWDFDEARLAVAADGQAQPAPWRDLASLLLSADALKESSWSLRHQRDARTTYGPDGLRDERYDIPEILNEYGGHRRTFLHNEQGFICGFAARKDKFAFRAGDKDTLAVLTQLFDHANERKVKLTLIVPPVHVRHLEVIRQSGLWPAFEDWKRAVSALAAERGIAFWDFAQANPVTAETVPPMGDRQTAMRWFRESSHALSSAGSAAIARIYGGDTPAGFGQRLTPDTLDAALTADRDALARWAAATSTDAHEISEVLTRCQPGMARFTSR